ncbi:MAG: immunity 53 family protein [Propionibacteriaceae bacterium]|jgi:hypothetical protein|nr:immunity 53 family protein [Propionibacteriaceae bacterium]
MELTPEERAATLFQYESMISKLEKALSTLPETAKSQRTLAERRIKSLRLAEGLLREAETGANSALDFVQDWYGSKCDGIWEHGYGMSVESLDNPGWKVTVDGESGKQTVTFTVGYDNDDDWLLIRATADRFEGIGDATKLTVLLGYLRDWLTGSLDLPQLGSRIVE